MEKKSQFSKQFHEINNTLGAVAMNLEVANDETYCKGPSLESIQDALTEVKRLRDQIQELRKQVDLFYE